MIASTLHEEDAVVCIHDDYCCHVEATEISQILLKIGLLISGSYSSITSEIGEFENIP